MELEQKISGLEKNLTASARIGGLVFSLGSARIWKGRDEKWRISGTVNDKSVLEVVGKSMLGPNKDPADVEIDATSGERRENLRANLTSSMESGDVVKITFTLLS